MRSFSLISLFLFITAASFGQGTYRIQGQLDSLGGTPKVYLRKQDNNSSRVLSIATTSAANGRFTLSHNASEIDFYTVYVDGVPGQVSFILDKDVTITGVGKDLRQAEVTGSPLTDEWKRFQNEVERPYRDQLMTLYNERQQSGGSKAVADRVASEEKRLKQEQIAKVSDYIRQHADSPLSLFFLSNYWNEMPKAEAQALYKGLAAPLKNHSVAKRMAKFM